MNIASNTNKTNFNGKIIYKNKISQESQNILNKFLTTKKDSKTNLQILKKKPYDLYVSEALGHLTLTTNYKKLFVSKPQEYYLVGIKGNSNNKDIDYTGETNFFRWGLKTFEEHKKNFNGYNNIFEKIIAIFKESY